MLEQEGFYNCYKVYLIRFTDNCLPRFNEYVDSLEDQTSAKLDINKKSYDNLLREIENMESDANNLDDHITFRKNIVKLIDLTIPLTN